MSAPLTQPLLPQHFQLLWHLWDSDPHRRLPSCASRKEWCTVNGNLHYERLNKWFGSRRYKARAQGLEVSDERYDMVEAMKEVEKSVLKFCKEEEEESAPLDTRASNATTSTTIAPSSSPVDSTQDPRSTPPTSPSTPAPDSTHCKSVTPSTSSHRTLRSEERNVISTPATSVISHSIHSHSRSVTNSPLPPSSPPSSVSSFSLRYDTDEDAGPGSSPRIWPISSSSSDSGHSVSDLTLEQDATARDDAQFKQPKRKISESDSDTDHEEHQSRSSKKPKSRDFSMPLDPLCGFECMGDCESLHRRKLWRKAERMHGDRLNPTEPAKDGADVEPCFLYDPDTLTRLLVPISDSGLTQEQTHLHSSKTRTKPADLIPDHAQTTDNASKLFTFDPILSHPDLSALPYLNLTPPLTHYSPLAKNLPQLHDYNCDYAAYTRVFGRLYDYSGSLVSCLDETKVPEDSVYELNLGQAYESSYLGWDGDERESPDNLIVSCF